MRGIFVKKRKQDEPISDKGFSVYICFGPWAGIGIGIDGGTLRLTLGFIGIGFMTHDLECRMARIVELIKSLDTTDRGGPR